MSKIAKKPITIPSGITAAINGGSLVFTGKGGSLTLLLLPHTSVAINGNEISVSKNGMSAQAKANWGTMASLIRNAMQGVGEGFTKTLEIEGIGFKASMEGKTLILNVGYTHPVRYDAPSGVTITVAKSVITVTGIDKQSVGQTAAEIRKIKKPEPYKGKGIHYAGEVIRRKAGKKVAGAGSEQK
jgi:large subunit ribosomal protein L6